MRNRIIGMAWIIALSVGTCRGADAPSLRNGTLALKLGTDSAGIPFIARVDGSGDGLNALAGDPTSDGWTAWIPADLVPKSEGQSTWQLTDDAVFHRAEATRELTEGLRITWVVELARQGALFRMHVSLTNRGQRPKAIRWFPAWAASWRLPFDVEWIRAWKPLSFRRVEHALTAGHEITLRSALHSSDDRVGGSVNPYWIAGGKGGRLCFGLGWSGGWEARLAGGSRSLCFSVRLPPDETQLTLAPGQTIAGPVLFVMPTRHPDDVATRVEWMTRRAALARELYGGPSPSYPLSYNNWYTTRFDVNADFLKRQVAAMDPYRFDAFIVDAGWYEKVGRWTPNTARFKPGEFEAILGTIKAKGVRVGIWSCPQFVNAPKDKLPPTVDVPGFYERFIDGHLLDLAGSDFTTFLTGHVTALRERYFMDWWKYDQLLFVPQTRAGVMRNVVAFQDALLAVRKAHPDLFIENCQSGGRMINEFTVLATQSQWLRDGGRNGLQHARDNVATVLGALEFVFPWAAGRWTNNFQSMDPDDDELTKLYCRSAMPGTWGIVSDLAKIADRQRGVILRETERYRRLNGLKPGYRYELALPAEKTAVAGITFYDVTKPSAAVLLYRWDRQGEFDFPLRLPALPTAAAYTVEDVDVGESSRTDEQTLREQGLRVHFTPRRMSALLFLEAIR